MYIFYSSPRPVVMLAEPFSQSQSTVLLIEDEAQVRRAVRVALRSVTGHLLEADTGRAALATLDTHRPDLIILDLGLPDMAGVAVCHAIRAYSTAPILVLTGYQEESEKVKLLNAGADDYVTKPFGSLELVARVSAQLRRARTTLLPQASTTVIIGELVLDFESRAAARAETPVRLTPTEWSLLRVLLAANGQVLAHQQLFDAVWGQSYGDVRQYLRVHITNLRKKIERDPTNPRIVVTEPSVGYRLDRRRAE